MTDIEKHSRRRSTIADTLRNELVVLTVNKNRLLYLCKQYEQTTTFQKRKIDCLKLGASSFGRRFRVLDEQCPVCRHAATAGDEEITYVPQHWS